LRRDPGYLDRSGYEVTDAKGRRIPSSAINWGKYGAKVPYNVRQTPSEANALGELKILFPNKHAIYMHDTPQKALFDRDTRAFSHGCVRLKDPRGMAAAVLGTTVEHIEAKLEQGHSSEKVTRKIPVYVAYFTAWPDANGRVEYFADVYDRDARLKTALEMTDELRASTI
jgi:murein L,D-transpeptidase YcbB/YkuD